MTQSDRHFEQFSGHTLLKHKILSAYLAAWAFKLLQGTRNDRLCFVDAFAGEGRDHEGNPGSPLIAARIASEVAGRLQPDIEHPPQILHLYAIENVRRRVDALTECLASFGPTHPGHVKVRFGELPAFIDEITEATGVAATLYFLDPFGIKGLDASTYPKALRGPQNEIFALFADMGASRLFGLIRAESYDLAGRIQEIRETPSLFEEWDREAEAEVTLDAQEYQRALDTSQPAAREHLSTALGGMHWVAVLEGQEVNRAGALFLGLFCQQLQAAGARFIMTMPMRNEQGQRVYSLVHASKSEAALLAMKEAVSTGLNKAILPPEVSAMIREDLRVSVDEVIVMLAEKYASRVVSWSQELRPAILTTTAMFPFQTEEVKLALDARGWLPRTANGKIAKPIVCTFPASAVS